MHQWGLCGKTAKKKFNQLFLWVPCKQSENIAQFPVKEMSGQISQFIWYRVSVWAWVGRVAISEFKNPRFQNESKRVLFAIG